MHRLHPIPETHLHLVPSTAARHGLGAEGAQGSPQNVEPTPCSPFHPTVSQALCDITAPPVFQSSLLKYDPQGPLNEASSFKIISPGAFMCGFVAPESGFGPQINSSSSQMWALGI